MTLDAGRLNKRVRLESPQQDRDEMSGAVIETWHDEGDAWAGIEPLSVRDFLGADARQSKVTARLVLRAPSRIQSDWRVVHIATGKIYYLAGVLPDADSGREYLTLAAGEGVVDPPG